MSSGEFKSRLDFPNNLLLYIFLSVISEVCYHTVFIATQTGDR